MKITRELFRVIAKNQAPEVKDLGNNKVLNFTVVPYHSKDGSETIWYQAGIWNEKSIERWENNLQHNDVLLLSGDLDFKPNKNSTDDNKLMPYASIYVDGYNLRKVQVMKLDDSASTQATEDVIAAKIAASNADKEDIPF